MSDYENKVVRGYRLDVTIGSGGFGTVYHAFQEVLQREVAVKVIKDKYVNDPQFVRQFEAEARIIARLEHFNIVALYDYWRDPSGAYLVMRWLRGGSLRSYLKQSKLAVSQIVRIINQTASALAFAHQHNVIHRDIKPENILLDNEGNAFLTDFGIAVDLRNQDNVNIENISFGSPDYVAPEQLKDKIITPRSDIYSLGIMLYELLASERPFVSDDAKEIMKMQLYNPVPSLRLKRPDLPPEIDTVIWQSTAKNPAHRFENVLELAVAFQNIAQKMENVPSNYIINTQVHNRVLAPQIASQTPGNMPTEHLGTASLLTENFANEDEDSLATGVLAGYEDGTPDFMAQIDTIPDALPTNIMPDGGEDELLNIFDDQNTPAVDMSDALHTPVQGYFDENVEDSAEAVISEDTNQFGDYIGLMTMTIEGEGPPNPYKGLRAFEEADAGSFFGREEVVAQLVSEYGRSEARFLALIGPSGSGKSSVVRAGMIPAFRRGAAPGSKDWFYSTMVPSDNPFRELSEAILRVAIIAPENWGNTLRESPQGLHKLLKLILPDDKSELLLFIDQFEEVFTLAENEEERDLFLNSLWFAVNQTDSRLRLIITLRADFYDRPLHYPQFGQMLKENTEVVLPLSLQELESAIMGPAGRVGLLVEPALKNAILNDVHNQPGALPLLQYALTELYERKDAKQMYLSHHQYRAIGGIEGALAQRARDIYEHELSSEEQNLAHKLFLRIISIDDNGIVTRRRVLWSEMMAGIENRETLQNVIDAFSKHRLLTQDRDQVTRSPTIEVAHEALIKGWQQLGQWIDQNRFALQKRQELRIEVDRWLSNERDKSYLASGSRLIEFEGLVNNDLLALRDEEKTYISEGVALRGAAARRTRLINIALSIFSLVTLILFVLALLSFFNANDARAEAVASAQLARSRELAASSLANEDQNDLALLLAVEAIGIQDTYEARNSLLLALQENSLVRRYFHGQDNGIRTVDLDNTGDIAVSGGLSGLDNTIIRWDTTTGNMIGEPLMGHESWINDVQISPNNQIIASASTDGSVRLWDFETGEELAILNAHEEPVRSLAFTLDSRYLASAGEDGKIIIWDVDNRTIAHETDAILDAEEGFVTIYSLDFNSTGTRLVSGSDDNIVRIWDAETSELLSELTGHMNWVRSVRFDPTDEAIISGDTNGALFFWDAEDASMLTDPINTGHAGGIRDITFSFDAAYMATAGADGRIIIWSQAQRGAVIAVINTHLGIVSDVEFSPNDYRLLSGSEDGDMLLSQLTAIQRPGNLLFDTNQSISEFAYDSNHSRYVLVGEPFGVNSSTIQVLDSNTIDLQYEINISDISEGSNSNAYIVNDLALSPDGSIGAVVLATGEIAVWDINSGDLLWIRSEHTEIPKEIEFTPDGSQIISADEAGNVLLWDNSGNLINTALYAPDLGVTAMAVSPNGQYLAIGGRSSIILWNLADETLIADNMIMHDAATNVLLFDANSETLFSGSRDYTIIQWSAETGAFIQRFTGHTDWVLALALNTAGDMLISSERTGSIRLWELSTGRPIGNALLGPNGWLTALNVIDENHIVGSNREWGVVLEWTLNFDDWVRIACDISNRTLSTEEWMQFFQDADYEPGCALSN